MSTDDFFSAAADGDLSKVISLLDQGVLVDSRGRYGATALFRAAYNGKIDVVSLLVQRGADLNHQSDSGFTALMDAAFNGMESTVSLLLDKGANPQLKNKNGDTALAIAQSQQKLNVVVIIQNHSAPVNNDLISFVLYRWNDKCNFIKSHI